MSPFLPKPDVDNTSISTELIGAIELGESRVNAETPFGPFRVCDTYFISVELSYASCIRQVSRARRTDAMRCAQPRRRKVLPSKAPRDCRHFVKKRKRDGIPRRKETLLIGDCEPTIRFANRTRISAFGSAHYKY